MSQLYWIKPNENIISVMVNNNDFNQLFAWIKYLIKNKDMLHLHIFKYEHDLDFAVITWIHYILLSRSIGFSQSFSLQF